MSAHLIFTISIVAAYDSSPPRNADSYASPPVRSDGLNFGYDPFSSEMVEKYGAPGKTDDDGFNPYTDSVGPGIYGGIVARDKDGDIVIGTQYQNHNPRPGPVYAGGGYAKSALALKSPEGLLTITCFSLHAILMRPTP